MNKCRKCGSYTIFGPFYRTQENGDYLQYRCARCGYSEAKPCNDSKETELSKVLSQFSDSPTKEAV